MNRARSTTGEPLVIAVPSKGRLQENALKFFERAGLNLVQARGAREYRGRIEGLANVEVAYLSASEIVTQLAAGQAHFGVTGEDLIREQIADADSAMELLTPLGFGSANVVVAVPQAWIDVTTMADLDDVAAGMRQRNGRRLRVATKYINLTRRHFAAHAIGDYQIVESHGATEGSPAAGTAEAIVDITTTGSTLAANGLKILEDGVILRSQANLVASLRANWTDATRGAATAILGRIAAEENARLTREIRAVLPPAKQADVEKACSDHAALLPFGLAKDGVTAVHCPAERAFALAQAFAALGATTVTVTGLDYVIRQDNLLVDRLEGRLRQR